MTPQAQLQSKGVILEEEAEALRAQMEALQSQQVDQAMLIDELSRNAQNWTASIEELRLKLRWAGCLCAVCPLDGSGVP